MEDYGFEADIEIFRPLFSKTRFPKLTYLGIVNSEEQDEIVWFLIQLLGDGTRRLAEVNPGDVINVVLPLGNGYLTNITWSVLYPDCRLTLPVTVSVINWM